MSEIGMWARTWAIWDDLQRRPSEVDAARIASDLAGDLVLARYVFLYRGFADPAWFEPLDDGGLFHFPPPLETDENGNSRAYGWPALTFLERVVSSFPERTAELVESFDTDNWWVISDALSIAAALPSEIAVDPALTVLARWENLDVQGTSPKTLTNVVQRLVEADDRGALREALARIIRRFLRYGAHHYELSEVLPQIVALTEASFATELADTIEEGLLEHLHGSSGGMWRLDLDDLDIEESIDVLVSAWLNACGHELSNGRAHPSARRATRLLPTLNPLTTSMGLRALDRALGVDRSERGALTHLNQLAASILENPNVGPAPAELFRVISHHFPALNTKTRAALLARFRELGRSAELRDRYDARDWLIAVEEHFGAGEEQVLDDLIGELRRPPPDQPRGHAIADFVRPDSPVSVDELMLMDATAVAGLLQSPPVALPSEDHWIDRGPEAFNQALRQVLPKRLDVWGPALPTFAEVAHTSTIVYSLCWGVREAFRDVPDKTVDQLDAIVEFAHIVMGRSLAGEFEADAPLPRGGAVERGVADLFESIGRWLPDTARPAEAVAVLRWLLNADDPARDGDESEDAPFVAINSVRGEALLACLLIRQDYWGDDARPRDELCEGVDVLLRENVTTETSNGVLSCYGRFLAALVIHNNEFFAPHRHVLLPAGEDDQVRWGAVFGSYIVFNGPHRGTAAVLRGDYELAADRLESLTGFIGQHRDRVLTHLIGLSLPRAGDASSWEPVLHRALDNAGTEPAAAAIADLAFAMRRDGLEVPTDWVLRFVRARTQALGNVPRHQSGGRGRRRDESRALVELVLFSLMPIGSAHSLLVSLLELGAAPRIAEVVTYLETADPGRTREGLAVLRRTIAGAEDFGLTADAEKLETILRSYSAHTDLLTSTLDLLGSEGYFKFEDLARELAVDTASDSGS